MRFIAIINECLYNSNESGNTMSNLENNCDIASLCLDYLNDRNKVLFDILEDFDLKPEPIVVYYFKEIISSNIGDIHKIYFPAIIEANIWMATLCMVNANDANIHYHFSHSLSELTQLQSGLKTLIMDEDDLTMVGSWANETLSDSVDELETNISEQNQLLYEDFKSSHKMHPVEPS